MRTYYYLCCNLKSYVINPDGTVFHLHSHPDALADKVILVGDPSRVDLISTYLDSIETSSFSREFKSVTGTFRGSRLTILSTGIGCDNIDIVMTELDALANVDFATREIRQDKRSLTVLRIGTCGALQPDIPIGSYIFSRISCGFDGLLNWYAGREEITDSNMEKAFLEHVGWNEYLPVPYFVKASAMLADLFADSTVQGITIAAPGFYGPQCRIVRLPIVIPDLQEKIESFRYGDLRFTNFEMESSALAGLARKLGHHAGTVCLAIANRYSNNADADYKKMMGDLIGLALEKLSRI